MIRLGRGLPLGIEITDTHIKICELRAVRGSRYAVKRFAMEALPADVMNDGRIQDEKLLLQTFRKALDKQPWSTSRVQFAIPSQSVMVRFLKLPNVAEKALRRLVDFEIRNNIHLPFEDPFYDYVRVKSITAASPQQASPYKLSQSEEAFRQQWELAHREAAATAERADKQPEAAEQHQDELCDVLLIAASRALLDQYTRLFRGLKLEPVGMEIKAFSLKRLVNTCLPYPQRELVMLVDVNSANCDLTIVQGDAIRITRNVPVSFVQQSGAVAADRTVDNLFNDFLPAAASSSYEASFSDLAGELERLMNFYRYTLNHRDAEFSRIVVTGDIPMLDELLRYLQDQLAQRVTVIKWDELQAPSPWNLSAYAVPLGLSLRGGK